MNVIKPHTNFEFGGNFGGSKVSQFVFETSASSGDFGDLVVPGGGGETRSGTFRPAIPLQSHHN